MNEIRHSEDWRDAVAVIRDAQRIAVFTGAGISAESGIATFRDEGGIWEQFPPEEFATWSGLMKVATLQPGRFAEFLLAFLEPLAAAEPNSGHLAIARLEGYFKVDVITQNVDGLHQAAGSSNVKEIHGSVFEIVSSKEGRRLSRLTRADLQSIVENLRRARAAMWALPRILQAVSPLLGVSLNGSRRPSLVLFGESLLQPDWNDAQQAADECDVLLAVGTSGVVYPAATIPERAELRGAQVITVDPSASLGGIWLRGRASDILPALVSDVLG